MPGVPFVYYGDEIGIDYFPSLTSKEGGYRRTGARTPMQWSNEKNCGFSTSDSPYLPTDERENAPTVEKQQGDENSLLSFVKTLVKLHRGNPALWADGGFEIKNAGYPFVFERFSDDKRVLVAINPSDNSYVCELLNNSKVLINQNTEISDGKAILGGVSILVAEQQLS